MSINACSINEHTINTLCGRRRRAIIDSLLPQTPVVYNGGSVQHVGNLVKNPINMFRREAPTEDFTQTELQHIQVTVTFGGVEYSQTLERDSGNIPLVTVYGLSSKSSDEESVNIFDVSSRIL